MIRSKLKSIKKNEFRNLLVDGENVSRMLLDIFEKERITLKVLELNEGQTITGINREIKAID
ncbi:MULTISPECIES: hypothetical protein [Bacillus]|uniref:hypothetical protein n=1 Tax=Bacillus TaxID=1386 RepID=UPI0015D48766|nr:MULTISPECIES: hypothetical protein [Bacillus]MCP1324318.1 hypothetical protein [Bacillus sp. S0628]